MDILKVGNREVRESLIAVTGLMPDAETNYRMEHSIIDLFNFSAHFLKKCFSSGVLIQYQSAGSHVELFYFACTRSVNTELVCNSYHSQYIVTLPRAPFACETESIRVDYFKVKRPSFCTPSLVLVGLSFRHAVRSQSSYYTP